MKLRRAEVVLIRMQFHQAQGSKIRPALVLFDAGDEDFVAGTHHISAEEFGVRPRRRGLAGNRPHCPVDGASA